MSFVVRQTVENIQRNWVLSLITVSAIALTITLFNIVLGLFFGSRMVVDAISQKADLTVTLKSPIDFYEIDKLIKSIEELPGVVTPVVYTSGEEAFDEIKGAFSLDENVLKKFGVKLPGTLTIRARSPEYLESVRTALSGPEFASKLAQLPEITRAREDKLFKEITKNLQKINDFTLRTLLAVLMIFLAVSAALMFHIIHLHFMSRQHEFSITRLLGAPRSSLSGPFILEGMMYSGVGVLLSIPFFLILLPLAMGSDTGALFSAFPLGNVVLIELIVGLLVGAAISALVVRPHVTK
ncbi:MAG: permease-like cell division protein FtsX [Patescibacteria group bacterium]